MAVMTQLLITCDLCQSKDTSDHIYQFPKGWKYYYNKGATGGDKTMSSKQE